VTTQDDYARLRELIAPYVWTADVTLSLPDHDAEVRATVRPAERVIADPADARTAHFETAQKVIAAVESDGWMHVEHPDIEVTGQVLKPLGGADKLVAEGKIYLHLARERMAS
jgi:hypothetical protein